MARRLPNASAFALWTRRLASVEAPPFLMSDLARHFGLQMRVESRLPKAGQLALRDGRLTILLQPGSLARQRFSAAHELCHYLLAAELKMPLAEQALDHAVEPYCNRYASHLLLPRSWVIDRYEGQPQSLGAVTELAERTHTSVSAALIALNESCGWQHVLVQWRFMSDCKSWAPTRAVGLPGNVLCGAAAASDEVLAAVSPGDPADIALPIRANDREGKLLGQVARLGSSFYSLFKLVDLLSLARARPAA